MSAVERPNSLPIPPHFNPDKVGEVWRVEYQERAKQAEEWAGHWEIPPAEFDKFKIALIAIDIQNTFCIPGFELFVAGNTGNGAVDDNRRLCEFIYCNLKRITKITANSRHPHFLSDIPSDIPC